MTIQAYFFNQEHILLIIFDQSIQFEIEYWNGVIENTNKVIYTDSYSEKAERDIAKDILY